MNQIEAKLAAFRDYCLSSGDQVSRAWLFTDGAASPFLRGSTTFSAPNSPLRIHLIDQYHGRRPTLSNYATLAEGSKVPVEFRPLVILDSNTISYINQYVQDKLEPAVKDTVYEFMSCLVRHEIDPSPVFYLAESQSKADPSRWREFALPFVQAQYTLQTLDRDLFLRRGMLASSMSRRAKQLEFHGVNDSKELIESYVDSLSREDALVEAENVRPSYAALLRIALMRLEPMPSLAESYIGLGEYMNNELGAILGAERIVALFHWADPERFARMIPPLQKGMSSAKFFRKVGSTAWDLRLCRFPEKLGEHIPKPKNEGAEVAFEQYYVATAEDGLARLVEQRSIELLIQFADHDQSSGVVALRHGAFDDIMTPEEIEEFLRRTGDHDRMLQQTAHTRAPLAGGDLDNLIEKLEAQVVEVCESG